jgi:hypothetical protein
MNIADAMERSATDGQKHERAEAVEKIASGWKQYPLSRSVPCSPPRVNIRKVAE